MLAFECCSWSCILAMARVKTKTIHYNTGINCFSAEYAEIRSKSKDWLARNQDNRATCLPVDCCFSELTLWKANSVCGLVQSEPHHHLIRYKLFSPWKLLIVKKTITQKTSLTRHFFLMKCLYEARKVSGHVYVWWWYWFSISVSIPFAFQILEMFRHWDRLGLDHMVVGITTTYAISGYHH